MTDQWVLAQQRTMTRWVSAKIGREIHDLTTDLCDGLVLLDLLNLIGEETGNSKYKIAPIYKKPSFAIQKMENVDYVLQFSRVSLQMNICNISAEDIVLGNLKLILGLIWSIFVYSTSNCVPMRAESRSMGEIKSIILRWLNVICKTQALPLVTNFHRDWSFQLDRRPELVFAAILEYYRPKLIRYRLVLEGRKLLELADIIDLAHVTLGIPDLVVADDFTYLVPDEKCILFYVLEWYMYFEVRNNNLETESAQSRVNLPLDSAHVSLDFTDFFTHTLVAVKLKNKYDTRSLRLLNRVNAHLSDLLRRCERLDMQNTTSGFVTLVDKFCADIDGSTDLESQLLERNYIELLEAHVTCLDLILQDTIRFKMDAKPAIVYSDVPELKRILKSLDLELKDGGFRCSYEPLKALSLESLLSKVRLLLDRERDVCSKIDSSLQQLLCTNLRNIDRLIGVVADALPKADKCASDAVQAFTKGLDLLLCLKAKVQEYEVTMTQEHTTSDLKTLATSLEFYHLPPTPITPEESLFLLFCDCVNQQANQSNLTYSDVKRFLRKVMPEHQFQGAEFQEFMRLIPTRTLLSRSESHEYGIASHLDDSDDSEAIFDKVSKQLESKLAGAHDKIYDLSMLVERMGSGFNV